MAAAHLKLAIGLAVIICLALTGAAVVWNIAISPPPASLHSPIPPPTAPAPGTLQAVYDLRPGEILRFVKPPFIDQRKQLYEPNGFAPANGFKTPPSALLLRYQNGKHSLQGMVPAGNGQGFTLGTVLQILLELHPQEIEADSHLLDTVLPGDIVYENQSDVRSRRMALEPIITSVLGTHTLLVFNDVPRPTIVFSGVWTAGPNPFSSRIIEIHISGTQEKPEPNQDYARDLDGFAGYVGEWINQTVIFRNVSRVPRIIQWRYPAAAQGHLQNRTLICDQIARQTGLQWIQQTRLVKRLFIEPAK